MIVKSTANCKTIDVQTSSTDNNKPDNNNNTISTSSNCTIFNDDSRSILNNNSDESGAGSSATFSVPSKRIKLTNIRSVNQYFLSLTDSSKAITAVSNFLVGCNIPLEKLKSKNFMRLIKVMCPAHKPLLTEMPTDCLNEAYDQLHASRIVLPEFEGILMISKTT